MLFCIAPAPAFGNLRLEQVKHCVEGALHDVGWSHKDLAAAMGFGTLTRIGLYYRQLRSHGLNFNLLTNADPAFFLALMARVCLMLGITKEQIAKALGIPYETAEERQRKQREQEARDRDIESRLRALEKLAGVRAADTQPPAENESADEKDMVTRRVVGARADGHGGGEGQAAAAPAASPAAGAERADRRALHLSI